MSGLPQGHFLLIPPPQSMGQFSFSLHAFSLQLFLKSSKMKVYLKIVRWKQPRHPVMNE